MSLSAVSMPYQLLITCEHGGNDVPPRYAHLFRGQRRVLESHRGYDPGTLELAREMAARLSAPLVFSTVTRLLVELNRSPGHRRLFSEFVRGLDGDEKQSILDEHYFPYRGRVEWFVRQADESGQSVLHLSVHSFAPVLGGEKRTADVGLLYDPARKVERQLCAAWRSSLLSRRPDLRVRKNYPYRGNADGLTTHLRKIFGARCYVGIELEINQRWPRHRTQKWSQLMHDLVTTFDHTRRVLRTPSPRHQSR